MYTFTTDLSKKEYDKFYENYELPNFMQEYNWMNVKNYWDGYHCGLYKENKLVGVASILVRKIKGISLLYVPRGYLIDFTNYEDLEAMTKFVKEFAKKKKAYMVKIDPNFCFSDDSFKNEEVKHYYSENYELKNNNLIKLGYKHLKIDETMKKNFQPQFDVFAPLIDKDGNLLNEEGVLKTYRSKFKYYLGDFHTKRGITFEISNSKKDLPRFIELMKITCKRQGILIRNNDYFERILDNFKDRAYMFFGTIDLKKYKKFLIDNNMKQEEVDEVDRLIKENGNSLTLSTGMLLLPGNKKGIRQSEYIYAGNSNELYKLNVSAGVVFEMIKFSIEHKCHYCNLGGVSGDMKDHLLIFKQKFNGQLMKFTGEYNLPTSLLYYIITPLYPVALKLYKLILRKEENNG